MIKLLKKAKITTWIAYVVHVILFSAIAHAGIEKWGFDWKYLIFPVVFPIIFLIQNIRIYDNTRKKQRN